MSEVAQVEKHKRERSPSFPFISLKTAVGRLAAFEDYFKRHPAPAKKSGLAWGMKGDSSQAAQTLAALKAFGFIDYSGSGESLQASLTEEGRNLLRAQQDSVKQAILRQAALRPKAITRYWQIWNADRPPDPVCLDELILKGAFTEAAAKIFLSVYDDTITYAKLTESDKVSSVKHEHEDIDVGKEDHAGNPPPPPPPSIKVGDFVQWTPNGADQFNPPRKVVEILPDLLHARVFGSQTGIPMSELTMVDQPKTQTPESVVANSAHRADNSESKSDVSVLMRGKRLEIMANVDAKGLETLREMLVKYEEILKLIN